MRNGVSRVQKSMEYCPCLSGVRLKGATLLWCHSMCRLLPFPSHSPHFLTLARQLSCSPGGIRSGFPQEQRTWHALLVPWMLLFPGRGTCPAGRMARTSLSQVLGRCVGTPPGARSHRFQPVPARQPGCSPALCACSRREDRELWREALGQAEHRADMLSMSQDCPRTPDGNSSWREPRLACKAAGSLNAGL